jgi:hypothetical protein
MLQFKKGFFALSMLIAFRLSAVNQLIHEQNDFSVKTEEGSFQIQRCFIDKELRGISEEKLSKLIVAGAYLKLGKINDSNDYTLRLGGRLNGGGPVTASIFYWTVKGLGYGVPAGIAIVTAGATIAPLIPAVAGPAVTAVTTGAISSAATTAAASGAGAVIAGTVTAGAGTAVAAGIVAGETLVAAVGAEAAATAAAGVLGAGGATTAYVAGVESASTGAFAVGMACWFLP